MPFSEQQQALVGRWDLVIHYPDVDMYGWLEMTRSGMQALVGQFVGDHGSTRPISHVEVDGKNFSFSIPKQFERGDGNLTVKGTLENNALSGTMDMPNGSTLKWDGKRAPSMRPRKSVTWGEPIQLFNGKDLSGWHVVQGNPEWKVEDGILRNLKVGGNLVTDQKFGDFKLHLQFRYAPKGNSGVYLRGRYEVQVLDQPSDEPDSHLQGGVYGFLTPSEVVGNGPNEWNTYDITLIGRQVTIVLNGTTVISQQDIPGITGGALDSDEGAPGPIMLQGDHTPVDYRDIVITPAL